MRPTRRSGALAAVALVVGIVVAGCAPASPSPSPSASPSPGTASPAAPSSAAPTAASSSSSATPLVPVLTSPPPAATVDGWRAVPEQDSVHGVQFQDVVWTGTRFVAVGSGLDDNGAFLDSSDGITWTRQPGSTADGLPMHLATGTGGVVAVGTFKGIPAAWWSPDGLTWTLREGAFPTPALGIDRVEVTSVAATDHGWLAVGRRDPECQLNCGLEPFRAMAWTSADGLKWKQVPDQASFGKAGMTGVARLGSGFVAVGLAKGRAVVWTSPNGSTWTRVADNAMFHPRSSLGAGAYIQVSGVAVGHDVAVALGMDGGGPGGDDTSVRAWWSADGRTWAKATGEGFVTGQVFSVVATPEGFLATGPSGEDSCRGGIWGSADGRAWRCVAADPAFEGFGPYAAATNGSIEVAVGLGPNPGDAPEGNPGAAWWRAVP